MYGPINEFLQYVGGAATLWGLAWGIHKASVGRKRLSATGTYSRFVPMPGLRQEVKGFLNAFAEVQHEAAIGRGLAAIRHKTHLQCRSYVRGVIDYALPRLLAVSTGSTFPSVSRSDIENIHVAVPPLAEQQAIACMLEALDDKIELNRRMNQTLEGMARAIFKSWFVDFDPVRTKAAGQNPPGLSSAIADLFPDSVEDSELGEIPKGWEAATVGSHFRLTMGQSPPGSTYNDVGDGLPFFQGRTDFGFRFPTRRIFCSAPTRFAAPGDTLVSVRAPVGDVNIAIERCAVGRGVAAIRHRNGSRSFTYHSMHNLGEHFQKFEAEGTVFGSINKSDFEKLPFVKPTGQVLEAFDRIASPIDDRIEVNEREATTLAAVRDALLPKLMSGELRVPDAERIVGRCA